MIGSNLEETKLQRLVHSEPSELHEPLAQHSWSFVDHEVKFSSTYAPQKVACHIPPNANLQDAKRATQRPDSDRKLFASSTESCIPESNALLGMRPNGNGRAPKDNVSGGCGGNRSHSTRTQPITPSSHVVSSPVASKRGLDSWRKFDAKLSKPLAVAPWASSRRHFSQSGKPILHVRDT